MVLNLYITSLRSFVWFLKSYSNFQNLALIAKVKRSCVLAIFLLFGSFGSLHAQQPTVEISVPFNEGFFGVVGNNPQDALNIVTFPSLGITRAFFIQTSSTGFFQAQGNDIPLTLRLQMSNGTIVDIPGGLVWRETANGKVRLFGFLANQGTSFNLSSFGGANYQITGGTAGGATDFGLEKIGSTLTFSDGDNVSGNAATSGLIDELNEYLNDTKLLRPAGPVTVPVQQSCSTTPNIFGTATLISGETLTVQVNGKTYTAPTVVVSGTNWSLQIPQTDALTANTTYSVTAIITNAGGYTLSDANSNELSITTSCDSDGDGVLDTDEVIDGTDPNNPCDYLSASQTVNPSQSWNNLDCDGDGDKNGTDTNPKDPCVAAPGSTPNTTNVVWRAADCDGDGVTNGKETDDGTDPNNFCSYVAASQSVATSQAWKNADCDGDGEKNETDNNPKDPCVVVAGSTPNTTNAIWRAADCDGDGVTNGKETDDGTDPNNFCSYVTASQTLTTSQAWKDADCDGDGDKNGTDTNPQDPCVSANGSVANTSNAVWRAADCDGDGVTNGKETDDGTDPKDFCSYVAASQTLATSQAWKNADCDGDGDKNGTDTNPQDPCAFAAGSVPNTTNAVWRAVDCDGDGVTNGKEADFGTDPNDPCSFNLASQTLEPSTAWKNADCDGDGASNQKEKIDGTNPNDPCSFSGANLVVNTNNAVWRDADCDGDGVTNGKEITDGTDPKDFCSYIASSQVSETSQAWKNADCDGDGDKNGTDIKPKDPCVYSAGSVPNITNSVWRAADCDGDGVTNGKETDDGTNPNVTCSFKLASQSLTPSLAWQQSDCDGDGVTNKREKEDSTNPLEPCSLIPSSQSVATSQEWKDLDCDKDGAKNGLDKNVLEPVAVDDETTAKEGERITLNIITNDDFIAGAGISITRVGGNAGGEATFDPVTGQVSYRGLPGEVGEVTIEYRVCNTQVNPAVCANATITITIDGTELLIPEAFTPNGNGKNDKWIIRGLAAFPDNKVTIFNRWGNKVYEASPYNNDWDGFSNSNLTAGGARVPAGSYFYVLELGNGKKFTGFVYVAY